MEVSDDSSRVKRFDVSVDEARPRPVAPGSVASMVKLREGERSLGELGVRSCPPSGLCSVSPVILAKLGATPKAALAPEMSEALVPRL